MELVGLDREIAALTELALVTPVFTRADLKSLVERAQAGGCRAVCLASSRIAQAYELIDDSELKLVCMIGFPFGAADADTKRFETEAAADLGAHEFELCLNPGLVKDGAHRELLREMRDVVEAADERSVKICFEPRLFSPQEIQTICALALDSGAMFVHLQQAAIAPEMVAGIRNLVGKEFGVKASGFRNFGSAQRLLEAGANRLGYLEVRV